MIDGLPVRDCLDSKVKLFIDLTPSHKESPNYSNVISVKSFDNFSKTTLY